ncbi:MAG: hypothetical protein AB7O43_03340 [Hyphomicrobiaceae bacterium]
MRIPVSHTFAQRRPLLVVDRDDGVDRPGEHLLWPSVLIFVAGWFAFSWPWLSGRVTIPWDAKAHFLPQVQFLASSIARGEWPFWAPYVFAGHPQIADPQSQIFSPPMLLLALLNPAPGNHAIDTAVLLCLLGGGLGVIWLFNENRWHPAGGLIAALGFSFGAAMAWRLQHYGQVLSLCYLPFAIIFLQRALRRRSIIHGLIAGVISGIIVVGRDQVALLEVYLLTGFVIAYWAGRRDELAATVAGSVKPLAAGVVGGILVAGVPVVLTALLAAQSNRPIIDFIGAGRGSLHPALLLTAITPHLYGAAGETANYWGPPSFAWQGTDLFIAQNVGISYIGAIPLVMLIVGIVRGDAFAPGIRFYTFALIFSLLYALGWYTPAFRAMYDLLPGVDLYRRPADAMFLIGALAALVAGFTVHRLAVETKVGLGRRLIAITLLCVAGLFAASLIVAIALDRLQQALLPLGIGLAWVILGIGALAAALWLRPIRPVAALALIGGFTAADFAINNGPNGASGLPPSMVAMLEPDSRNETLARLKTLDAGSRSDTRRDRIELAGLGFNWPNASLTHRLENTLGYNPVRLGLYSSATGAEDHVGLPDQRKFSPLFPSYRSRLADLLGLRFIATGVPIEQIDKRLKPGEMPLLARTKDGFIYENTRAMPRVLFAQRAQTADFDRMLKDGVWPDVDPNTTVLLEAAPSGTVARRPGKVAIRAYHNTEVVIDVDSPDGGFVVLNDVWQPWWFGDIDGRPAPVLRANVIFRAVEVARGRHRVRFSFRPLTGAMHQIMAEATAPKH